MSEIEFDEELKEVYEENIYDFPPDAELKSELMTEVRSWKGESNSQRRQLKQLALLACCILLFICPCVAIPLAIDYKTKPQETYYSSEVTTKVEWDVSIQYTDVVKALALLIYIKCHNGASVVANFNYKKISKLTGLSRETIKKRLNILGDLGLLDLVGIHNQHLLFKRVRAPKSNIDISKLDTSSVKSTETGLRALVIVEIQRQKQFVEQKVIKGTSPQNGKLTKEEYREFKRAKKFCKSRGIDKFVDNGISYNTLAKRMGVGLNKTSEAIKYGVEHGMFFKHKHIEVYAKAKGNAQIVIDSLGFNNLFTTRKNNIVYSYACNTYSIIGV